MEQKRLRNIATSKSTIILVLMEVATLHVHELYIDHNGI